MSSIVDAAAGGGRAEHAAPQSSLYSVEDAAPSAQAADGGGVGASLRGRRLLMLAHSNSAHTARWARYFQQRGMGVKVVSPVEDRIDGVDVVRFPANRAWYHHLKGLHLYIDYPRWKALFREFRPDVTHIHYPDLGGRARFYLEGLGPIVTSTWGSEVVESEGFPLSAKHKAGVRRVLERSAVVTATTRFLAGWTARYCRPRTPIHIIPFGVDCDLFKPDPAAQRNDGLVRLGFFKNLERKYGPEVLVEAMALIAKECPLARLMMCGKGEMAEGLKRRVAELGLSDRVEFPGRLPHERVVRAMQEADIVLMPSTCEESFGVAAIEASACEVPVVATRVGGVPEAVVDGITGVLVPPHDVKALARACVDLIRDPQRRRQIGVAGRKYVLDHYQWSSNAAIMASVYEQLIGSGLRGVAVQTPNMIMS